MASPGVTAGLTSADENTSSLGLQDEEKSAASKPHVHAPESPVSDQTVAKQGDPDVYAQAQRMVDLEIDGRVHRISIYDKLDVITDDDPTAQEIMECNSNKENNEKPQQVLRIARVVAVGGRPARHTEAHPRHWCTAGPHRHDQGTEPLLLPWNEASSSGFVFCGGWGAETWV
ncbi:hypothetical protein DPEC_G00362730 [Dallia pectoralis]|nr:hypothetical protein DPEC_G00362730 [Dallia pectoralis]